MSEQVGRSDYIRQRVYNAINECAQDYGYWKDTPPVAFETQPLWYEIRDAFSQVLFEIDREQADFERQAREIHDAI